MSSLDQEGLGIFWNLTITNSKKFFKVSLIYPGSQRFILKFWLNRTRFLLLS